MNTSPFHCGKRKSPHTFPQRPLFKSEFSGVESNTSQWMASAAASSQALVQKAFCYFAISFSHFPIWDVGKSCGAEQLRLLYPLCREGR